MLNFTTIDTIYCMCSMFLYTTSNYGFTACFTVSVFALTTNQIRITVNTMCMQGNVTSLITVEINSVCISKIINIDNSRAVAFYNNILIGTGIISFSFFSWAYMKAVNLTSLGVAAVLLYTAPTFVMLFSILLFLHILNTFYKITYILYI